MIENEPKFNNEDIKENEGSNKEKSKEQLQHEIDRLKDSVFRLLLIEGSLDIKELYEKLSESEQQIQVKLEGYDDRLLLRAITSLKDKDKAIVIENKKMRPIKLTYHKPDLA
jgi:hypothetical protein